MILLAREIVFREMLVRMTLRSAQTTAVEVLSLARLEVERVDTRRRVLPMMLSIRRRSRLLAADGVPQTYNDLLASSPSPAA